MGDGGESVDEAGGKIDVEVNDDVVESEEEERGGEGGGFGESRDCPGALECECERERESRGKCDLVKVACGIFTFTFSLSRGGGRCVAGRFSRQRRLSSDVEARGSLSTAASLIFSTSNNGAGLSLHHGRTVDMIRQHTVYSSVVVYGLLAHSISSLSHCQACRLLGGGPMSRRVSCLTSTCCVMLVAPHP